MALGQMNRADATAWKNKYRAAEAAGEEARRKAMLEPGLEATPENLEKVGEEEAQMQKTDEVNELREKLADLQEKFDENPKKPGLKAQITKLNKKLDKAEANLSK